VCVCVCEKREGGGADRQAGKKSVLFRGCIYMCVIICVCMCMSQLRVLTFETAFSGAMLDRSQYAPSSNSAGDVVVAGSDVAADDASLMLCTISWTWASVGGEAVAVSPWSGSGTCPLDRCSDVPLMLSWAGVEETASTRMRLQVGVGVSGWPFRQCGPVQELGGGGSRGCGITRGYVVAGGGGF
jgi:hypothetical protein